jgi:hypothetical protein
LDEYKKYLKESLLAVINDNINGLNAIENKSEEDLALEELLDDPDLVSDIEKICEVYDDKVSALKENIETTRATEHDRLLKSHHEKEYYRNRNRINDINEIFTFYQTKLKEQSIF